MSKQRARITYRGREHHLGYFDTQFEADCAKAVALKLLLRLERTKPAARPPSLDIVSKLVTMGTFDGDPETMRQAALALHFRYTMVKGMKHNTRGWGDNDMEVDPDIEDLRDFMVPETTSSLWKEQVV